MKHSVEKKSQRTGKYSIVILNGRIMDPYTRLDTYANIGIKEGKISSITPADTKLEGDKVIDANGLVVAPGFINIHGHGSGIGVGGQFHVLDGVTTEITGNCGRSGSWDESSAMSGEQAYPLKSYFSVLERQGLLINLASYSGHITLREAVGLTDVFLSPTKEQIEQMVKLVRSEMENGALGITFGPFYGPGSTFEEMVTLAKEVARLGGCVASHVRSAFPPKDVEAIIEAIDIARQSDVPFIISHMGGPTLGPNSTGIALELIMKAEQEGLKIATDCHPYDSSCTALGAAVFETPPEQFLGLLNREISDLEVGSTVVIDGKLVMKAGEAFTSIDQFTEVRAAIKSGKILDPFVIGQ